MLKVADDRGNPINISAQSSNLKIDLPRKGDQAMLKRLSCGFYEFFERIGNTLQLSPMLAAYNRDNHSCF